VTAPLAADPIHSGFPRLRPAPHLEPPYDDALPRERARLVLVPDPGVELPLDRELPLEWERPQPGSGQWEALSRRRRRNSTSDGTRGNPSDRQSQGLLPDPKAGVRGFVKLCVEVLEGRRPLRQLRICCTPAGYGRLMAELPVPMRRRNSQNAPNTPRIKINTIRTSQPHPRAVEAAVVLEQHGRSWAIALRMEAHDNRWLCTFLQVI